MRLIRRLFLFFFNDTATTEIYTLSLHDALPISPNGVPTSLIHSFMHGHQKILGNFPFAACCGHWRGHHRDRKSTRLNSSHSQISYAVFCLKKKKPQK